jgi:hypothetical protein
MLRPTTDPVNYLFGNIANMAGSALANGAGDAPQKKTLEYRVRFGEAPSCFLNDARLDGFEDQNSPTCRIGSFS